MVLFCAGSVELSQCRETQHPGLWGAFRDQHSFVVICCICLKIVVMEHLFTVLFVTPTAVMNHEYFVKIKYLNGVCVLRYEIKQHRLARCTCYMRIC